jgi:hypothetical protein
MTVFSDALSTAFNCMNDARGIVATWNGNPVKGDFNRNYQSPLDVENYGPAFECMAVDVPAVAAGSTIIINGTTYTVKGPPQFGEDGDVLLILSED